MLSSKAAVSTRVGSFLADVFERYPTARISSSAAAQRLGLPTDAVRDALLRAVDAGLISPVVERRCEECDRPFATQPSDDASDRYCKDCRRNRPVVKFLLFEATSDFLSELREGADPAKKAAAAQGAAAEEAGSVESLSSTVSSDIVSGELLSRILEENKKQSDHLAALASDDTSKKSFEFARKSFIVATVVAIVLGVPGWLAYLHERQVEQAERASPTPSPSPSTREVKKAHSPPSHR